MHMCTLIRVTQLRRKRSKLISSIRSWTSDNTTTTFDNKQINRIFPTSCPLLSIHRNLTVKIPPLFELVSAHICICVHTHVKLRMWNTRKYFTDLVIENRVTRLRPSHIGADMYPFDFIVIESQFGWILSLLLTHLHRISSKGLSPKEIHKKRVVWIVCK